MSGDRDAFFFLPPNILARCSRPLEVPAARLSFCASSGARRMTSAAAQRMRDHRDSKGPQSPNTAQRRCNSAPNAPAQRRARAAPRGVIRRPTLAIQSASKKSGIFSAYGEARLSARVSADRIRRIIGPGYLAPEESRRIPSRWYLRRPSRRRGRPFDAIRPVRRQFGKSIPNRTGPEEAKRLGWRMLCVQGAKNPHC